MVSLPPSHDDVSSNPHLTSPAETFPIVPPPANPTIVDPNCPSSTLQVDNLPSGTISSPNPNSTPTTPHPLTTSVNITNLVTVKLSSDNYQLWSSLMTSYLVSTDLFQYVDGTILAPSLHLSLPTGLTAANPSYPPWLKINHSVRATLLATISQDLMMEVYDILPAYDIWSTVRSRFLENTMARELELREQLLSLRLTTQPMSTYLRDMKSVADRLNSIGKTIPPTELITYTLRGLPRDYNTLVTTLSYATVGLTFDQLRANLLNHEQRLRQQEAADSFSPPTALYSTKHSHSRGRDLTRPSPSQRGGRGRHPQSSSRHSPHAHLSNQRLNPLPSLLGRPTRNPLPSPSGYHPTRPIECQICSKQGHSAATCYQRYNQILSDVPQSFAALSMGESNGATGIPIVALLTT
ncbi:hypothetical protein MLD38_028650 [Melastoma candidum]|uniref:Uncharacterized protein n=1 Tax=Melastoma candidum TaxID=119954 RepID=A0ACB9N1Q5_9MYRT|nr:hypothetical protein MLD38_028650 [Melastoma candidum]